MSWSHRERLRNQEDQNRARRSVRGVRLDRPIPDKETEYVRHMDGVYLHQIVPTDHPYTKTVCGLVAPNEKVVVLPRELVGCRCTRCFHPRKSGATNRQHHKW